jgi:thiamine biosynthesis protein ThiI
LTGTGTTLLVRYGELARRTGRTCRTFERALIKNIDESLLDEGLAYELRREPGRLFVVTGEPEAALARLRDVFGIRSCSAVIEGPTDLDALVKAGVRYAMPLLPARTTFAVRARRTDDHPYTSMELARALGAALQKKRKSLRVDLDNPAVELFVEVRQKRSYLYHDRGRAVGGLPLGTEGRSVALLNDGMDSLVAAWLMMRRGCVPLLLHIGHDPHGGWGPEEAFDACRPLKRFAAGHDIRFHSVPFGDVLSAIAGTAEKRHLCVLCRRAALMAADLVADSGKADLVVAGDTLGHSGARTLHNLSVTGQGCRRTVARPLIGMDRSEVDRWAERAGLTSARSLAACCALDAGGQGRHAKEAEVADEAMILDMRELVADAVARRERRVL